MVDYSTAPLSEIKAHVVADGIIDAEETRNIRARLLEDGKVDREEADFLFEVNDAVTGKDNHHSYESLFVELLTAHVLQDDDSPGVLDDAEWQWLKSKVEADGKIDPLEAKLLQNIAANANEAPEDFKTFVANLG